MPIDIFQRSMSHKKNCDYWLLFNDLTHPSIVSVAHIYVGLLVCNTLSTLYCLARGINSELVSILVVFKSVYLACSSPICHHSLSYSGDTVE